MGLARLVYILSLILGASLLLELASRGENSDWDKYTEEGKQAYSQGAYAAAERSYTQALKESEKFGDKDPRYGSNLNSLGDVYYKLDDYPAAKRFYEHALAVREKALGSKWRPALSGLLTQCKRSLI